MQAAVLVRQAAECASSNPRMELHGYLDSPLVPVDDIVAWWGVSIYNVAIFVADFCYSKTPYNTQPLHASQGTTLRCRVHQSLLNVRSPAEA